MYPSVLPSVFFFSLIIEWNVQCFVMMTVDEILLIILTKKTVLANEEVGEEN